MFGDMIFADIPFATFDTEAPEPYTRSWINQCKAESTWVDESVNELSVKECDEWQ